MRAAATATTTESSQTPDEEARDILAKALRNQAEDGPSTRRAAIRAYKYLYAFVQQHGPQLQKVYEASKEHATRSKGNDESLKYRAQPQELPTVPPQLTSELLHFFFFLWYGQSRSKARSLHEKKLLVRKLLHGRRWSHAAWQIIIPPARFASHHPKDSKANSERGKSPARTTTRDLPRTQ